MVTVSNFQSIEVLPDDWMAHFKSYSWIHVLLHPLNVLCSNLNYCFPNSIGSFISLCRQHLQCKYCLHRIRIRNIYSVIFQTQETSAKTISGRCRRGHLEK